MAHLIWLLFCLALNGCHRPPSVSSSAAPSAAKANAPLGSLTTNLRFEKKLDVLARYIDGQISPEKIQRAQNQPTNSSPPSFANEETAIIYEIHQVISPERLKKLPLAHGPSRQLLQAEFYFYERRLIESATLLSSLLDKNPLYPQARNLLARCFYFLGNPDRSILELEYILTHQLADTEEIADALFLLGAIIHESEDMSAKNLKKGLAAWEAYLKIAPQSTYAQKVKEGIAALKAKLAKPKASAKISKAAQTAPFASSSDEQSAPYSQLKTQAIAAFEAEDLFQAEHQLKHLLEIKQDPQLLTLLARIYIKTARIEKALFQFDKATSAYPLYVPAWHYKGMAFIMNGEAQKAISCWEKVIQLDPNYAKEHQLSSRIQSAHQLMGKP